MSVLRTVVEAARSAGSAILVPGAADAITARLIEQIGFEAVYVTGAGLANARYGYPDIGLIGLSEVVDHVSAIAEATSIPLVVDADTGFGNAINVQRTVRLLERAGAAAIQIEDQVSPKRCGHFDGKEVIGTEEMVQKVRAAVDARRSDTLIIARTDAAAVLGIDEALARAAAYQEAGADVLFVEAPTTVAELKQIPERVPGIHIVNVVEGGRTPILSKPELASLGFTLIVYANSAMRGSVFGAREVLRHLWDDGTTDKVADQLITWDERQELVGKRQFDELQLLYRSEEDPTS